MKFGILLVLALGLGLLHPLTGSTFKEIPTEPSAGDAMLESYFEKETRKLTARSEALLRDVEDWPQLQADLRRQLFEMLGLQPLPARSDLKARVTGYTERDGIIVENILFQSRPGLYVTANFYRPEKQEEPLPTILYLCGHGRVKIDEVSFGNKTHYQHHATWFAKNGYTCLVLDTLQLGEIEGIHHGTHRYNRWWWNSRGYTPAGVEAWNSIRAIDYLETREEVDKGRIGATGRSGGGAYTAWIAALDERIQVSAPVAGITSLKNHLVDGCIEGHCDCMFMVNTYRWDFPLVTALVAPRPQLILNTDKDHIFPVDGVVDVYSKTAALYDSLGASNQLGLAILEGGHKDVQTLRVPAFQWFERHLKGMSPEKEIENTVTPRIFEPAELKVLDEIPSNERNTYMDEYFTRRIPRTLKVPESKSDWAAKQSLILSRLKTRTFRGWPSTSEDLNASEDFRMEKDGIAFSRWSFDSQTAIRLPLYLATPAGVELSDLDLLVVNPLDEEDWFTFLTQIGSAFPEAFAGMDLPDLDSDRYDSEKGMHASQKWGMAYLSVRGIGPTAWTSDEKEQTHIRRRFALLGQTLDSMRIWDIRRGIQTITSREELTEVPLWLQAGGHMAGNALYAALYEPGIVRLDLHELPTSHRDGPELLNVLRFTDLPEVAAIVGSRSQLRIYPEEKKKWAILEKYAEKLEWPPKQLKIRELP